MPRRDKNPLLPVKKPMLPPTISSAVVKPVIPSSLSAIERPSLLSSIKQGFGFGLGNSLVHRLFGPSTVDTKNIEFTQCMEKTYTTYEDCAHHIK